MSCTVLLEVIEAQAGSQEARCKLCFPNHQRGKGGLPGEAGSAVGLLLPRKNMEQAQESFPTVSGASILMQPCTPNLLPKLGSKGQKHSWDLGQA